MIARNSTEDNVEDEVKAQEVEVALEAEAKPEPKREHKPKRKYKHLLRGMSPRQLRGEVRRFIPDTRQNRRAHANGRNNDFAPDIITTAEMTAYEVLLDTLSARSC